MAAVTVLFTRRGLGAVASDFSDPTNERLIYLSAVGLVVVGIALLVGTIVWWRRGRQEHPALAPLEILGSRGWNKASEGDRRRKLDQVRVGGSGVVDDNIIRPEPVDLRELLRSTPQAFDDLRDPGPDGQPLGISIDAPLDAPVEPPAEVIDASLPDENEVPAEEPRAAETQADIDPAAQPAVLAAPHPSPPAGQPAVQPVAVDPDATTFAAPQPVDQSAAVPGGNS
jgi:hypothetical protein